MSDKELYIGSTNDLRRRLKEHSSGKSFATAPRRPYKFAYYEGYSAEEDARRRENSLKLRGQARHHLINRISASLRQMQS